MHMWDWQAVPQAPQLLGSVCTLTQLLPQRVKPVLQMKLHVPPVQIALAFATAGQTVPHAPQLFTSLAALTQTPLQLVKPALQVTTHVPLTQVAVPLAGAVHMLPQVPQLLGSVCASTQLLPQRMKPALQMKLHVPPVQVALALAGAGHVLPHAPQLATSAAVSTHRPAQFVVPAWQTHTPPAQVPLVQSTPVTHVPPRDAAWQIPPVQMPVSQSPGFVHGLPGGSGWQMPPMQSEAFVQSVFVVQRPPTDDGAQIPLAHTPLGQTVPHTPQLFGSICALTQPLPQRVKPALQVKPHVPPVQVAVAFAGAVQAFPQVPQFLTSLGTQAPLHKMAVPPAGAAGPHW